MRAVKHLVVAAALVFAAACGPDLPREPATVVFTGKMSYHANVAAALDLATQVMPTIWSELPDARLVLAGKDPTPELLKLTTDSRISVTGTVPDLRPYLARASVAVTPIRYGVGIQNKVLEAMSMATPVVSTPQAVSALQVQPKRDLLVAETPEAIARAVLTLLPDAALRRAARPGWPALGGDPSRLESDCRNIGKDLLPT